MNGLRSRLGIMVVVVVLAALGIGVAIAQEGGATPAHPENNAQPAAPPPAAQVSKAASPSDQSGGSGGSQALFGGAPTFKKLFYFSPYINTATLVLSVIAVVMFLFMMLAVTSRGFSPPRFVDNITKLVLARQFDQAIHLCQTHGGVFVSSVFQRVLENRDKDHAVILEIISAEGRRRAEPIWNRVNILSEISNIGPMIGLLGTVYGMIGAFFTLRMDVTGRADQLAGNIGVAMGTTLFGLTLAIAAGVFYTLLRSRVTGVLAEAELACHTLADHVVRSAVDPRLKKIDALADAARQKIALAAAARTGAASGAAPTPRPSQP